VRYVNRLIVHHTATAKDDTVEKIRKAHLLRGFSDIGYHAVIDGDGDLHRGRPEGQMGAHALGANQATLGVSLCGNFEIERVETAQLRRLVALLCHWCQKYGVASQEIYGHRDVGSTRTLCPGAHLYGHLSFIRQVVQIKLDHLRARHATFAWPVNAV
jgi:N-acetyl-anhydromuramyl-L-alanine amidase AmpD